MNYTDWPNKNVSVSSLMLDDSNPRIGVFAGDFSTQRKIISHLFAMSHVIDLAKSIVNNGFFPTEVIIVVEENGKYKVLEGNRRVCACKVLREPTLLFKDHPKTLIANRLAKLAKANLKNWDWKIPVIIAPSKESADVIIAKLHTQVARKKWTSHAQGFWYYKEIQKGASLSELSAKYNISIGDIKSRVMLYELAKTILLIPIWTDDQRNFLIEREDEGNFVTSNIMRLLNHDEDILDEVGTINVTDDGELISTLGRDDFISLLTELTILSNFYKNYENYDFSNIKELNSRNINNNEQKIEYVKKLKFRKNNDVIQERFNSKKYEDESDIILDKDDLADKVGKEAKKKPARKNKANSKKLYIMPQDLCIDCSKYPKVNKLLTEMQELDLNRYHAVVSTSFRSLAEYTAKCYKIKVQGGNKDEIYSASTNLNGLIDAVINDLRKKNIISDYDKNLLKDVFRSEGNKKDTVDGSVSKGIAAISTLNKIVHDPECEFVPADLVGIWNNSQLFFEKCWEEINKTL